MSQKPERSRPAARSTLVPSVEPINTGTAPTPQASPEPAASTPAAPTQRAAAPKATPPTAAGTKTTSTTVSLKMNDALIAQAKTAVLKTAGTEGGYKSFAALVQGGLERELQRLASEFNGGAPFEAHEGEFRRGRPLS